MGETADAPPPPVAVWVDYSAPEGCPDHRLLMSRISERNARLVESSDALAPQRYLVAIEPAQNGFLGRLEQPETRAVREVSGADCSRVVDALALVVALSATEESEKKPELEATSEPTLPAKPATVPPAQVRAASSIDAPVPVDVGPPERARVAWLVAAGGVVLSGIDSSPAVGPVVGFDWSHDDRWLSLRGSARWAFGVSSAETSSWQLVPEICLWFPLGALELSGCGGSAFGRVVAEGTPGSMWVAPLAGLGVRAPLVAGSWGELRGEVGAPLVRSERPASPDRPGFETPGASFGASLMVGFGGEARKGMKTSGRGHGGM